MKIGANACCNPKSSGSLRDKFKVPDFHSIRIDVDTKPTFNMVSSSTRHQFSSLSEVSSGDYTRQLTTSSAFNSPKVSSTYTSQCSSSTFFPKQVSSNLENRFLIPEQKKDIYSNKSQPESSKRPSLGKFSTGTGSNRALSQKIDFHVAAQKANQFSKTESGGTSKEDRVTIESPKNTYQRKERFFGSYEPTPTNSASKKTILRTEASASGKKPQDFDLRDILSPNKTVTSPSNKNFMTRENLAYPRGENLNTANRTSSIDQKTSSPFDIQTREVKTENAASLTTAKPNVFFNSLISPSNKTNERPFNKGYPRSFHEQDFIKLNSVNDSTHLNLNSKVSPSMRSSNSFKTNSVPSQFNEKYKPSHHAYSNHNAGVSPSSTLSQRFEFGTNQFENQSILSASTLYKEKRYNYQQFLRGKREELEKSSTNQSAANQTLKSSTINVNSLENTERTLSNKSNIPFVDPNSRLTSSNINSARTKLTNSQKQLEDVSTERVKVPFDSIVSDGIGLAGKLKQYVSGHADEIQSHKELENLTGYHSSHFGSQGGLMLRTVASNIQDIIGIEKKKNEVLKTRISMNVEAHKFHNERPEFADTFKLIQTTNNVTLESQSTQEKSYPISAKNSVSSLFLESGTNSGYPQRGASVDDFEPLFKHSHSKGNSPSHLRNGMTLESDAGNRSKSRGYQSKSRGYQSMTLEPECFRQKISSEKIEREELNPSSNFEFIEYEEMPVNDLGRHLNSREKKHPYKLESDHKEHQVTERHHIRIDNNNSKLPDAFTSPMMGNFVRENDKLSINTELKNSEQLQKLAARMKNVLEDNQNREHAWKAERTRMQNRIDDLERRLSKYEP